MNKRTSLLFVATLSLGLLAGSVNVAKAQTNTAPPIMPGVTNLESGAGLLSSVTNFSANAYGSYNKDTHKWGGGVMIVYNFTADAGTGLTVGTGVGAEVMGNDTEVLNGNVTLKLPLHPFGFIGLPNIVATPFADMLLGRGVGSGASGGAAIGTGGGLSIDIADIGKGWMLNAFAGANNWSGAGPQFNGWHLFGGAGVHHGL